MVDAAPTIRGLDAGEVDSNVGDTEPVALTVWIFPVESPVLFLVATAPWPS